MTATFQSSSTKTCRAAFVAALIAAAVVPALPVALADVNTGASALDLAHAIAADPGTVAGAEFLAQPPNGTPIAVSDIPITNFPNDGATYAILSSGDASQAHDLFGETSNVNDGGAVRGVSDRDVVILRVDLDVPEGLNCLRLEYQFFSEEFPEVVGSVYDEGFVAELDASTWTTGPGGTLSAPDNFATDQLGNTLTINGAGAATMSLENVGETPYDGATPPLRKSLPITPGAHALYLSMFDQTDQVVDSVVLIDAMRFVAVPNPADCDGVEVIFDVAAAVRMTHEAYSMFDQVDGTVAVKLIPGGIPAFDAQVDIEVRFIAGIPELDPVLAGLGCANWTTTRSTDFNGEADFSVPKAFLERCTGLFGGFMELPSMHDARYEVRVAARHGELEDDAFTSYIVYVDTPHVNPPSLPVLPG